MNITIGKDEDHLKIDDQHVAFDKDQKIYKVWVTEKNDHISFGTIGCYRFVLKEDGEILATSYPLHDFNNDFDMVEIDIIKKWEKRIKEFKNFE